MAKAGNRFMVTQFFVDVVLYTSLPECSSVISNALSVVALFLCLHLGGWFVGLPSYGIVWFVLDKNSQSTIVSKASRSSLGFAWGVITCVVSCAFAYLIPYFSFSATVLVVILVFLICYTLYRSSTTLPQHLSKCDLADRCALVLILEIVF